MVILSYNRCYGYYDFKSFDLPMITSFPINLKLKEKMALSSKYNVKTIKWL